jgi:hypothetical protein
MWEMETDNCSALLQQQFQNLSHEGTGGLYKYITVSIKEWNGNGQGRTI